MKNKDIEGILCNLYNSYLTQNNYKEFVEKLKYILDKKKIKFKIEKNFALRNIKRPFFIQVVIKNRKYILIENENNIKLSPDEICHLYPEYPIYLKGKFFPRGIINEDISKIYQEYIKTHTFDYYYQTLEKHFTLEMIAIIYERDLKKNKLFNDYLDIIDNSIKLYIIGEYNAAVAILLPCIEGILRKISNSKLKKIGYDTSKNYLDLLLENTLKEWQNIIYPQNEYWFLPKLEEKFKILFFTEKLSVTIKGFFSFLKDFLYTNIDDFKIKYPEENLNRHSIFHGYTINYGTKYNWLYIFGMIDFLLVLSNFNIFKTGHNIMSLAKFMEYNLIKENQNLKIKYPLYMLINSFKIKLKKYIDFILLKLDINKKDLEYEIFYILKNSSDFYFIDSFYYWIYDYEKNLIRFKHGQPGITEINDEIEKDLVIISFNKTNVNDIGVINYYIDLRTLKLTENI